MFVKYNLIILLLCLGIIQQASAIWCYQCTSATPGCTEDFNWRGIGYLGAKCNEDDDICVKIIEKKADALTITRDCLSNIRGGFRTDIPPDKYEGCRPAVPDYKLANYVNNSVKEYDLRRDHYDFVEFCFCFLDHRCNDSISLSNNFILSTVSFIIVVVRLLF